MENHTGKFVPKKDIYCLGTDEIIDRVCSLRGMNTDESIGKVGIDYGKWFLKVYPTTTIDYCNDSAF